MTNHRIASTAAVLAMAMAAVAGCSQSSPTAAPPAPAAISSPALPPPSPTPAAMDAAAVLATLTAAGLPITNGAVQDENTDPNKLLGRPNGYTSRASFDVPGGDQTADKYDVDRGGVIEVWSDAAGAKARADYIQGVLKAGGAMLGTEYDYQAGSALVRISGNVKPSVAQQFQAAAAQL